jgi:ribonuclease HII
MHIIGIDEVGRGCWAGPLLVVAASTTHILEGLTDSKLLTRLQRENLYATLKDACRFGEGWVSSAEIDEIGLAYALRLGITRALDDIEATPQDEIILDGSVNYVDSSFANTKCIIKADLTIPIVSAASIYAKVTRDNYMRQIGEDFPNYGFDKHVGYGTALHRKALETYGSTIFHRQSFKPVKLYAT